MNRLLPSALIALAVATVAAAGEAPPGLESNPFERPAWLSDAREVVATAAAPRARLQLRATLVAGKHSLANVGGEIVAIGQQVDGYRLMAVSEGAAVFADGDKVIRVTVIPDAEAENDNE